MIAPYRSWVFLCASVIASASIGAERSAEQRTQDWYTALGQANASAFEQLLSDDAIVVLEDLGVEQDKREFLESLEALHEALGENGSIEHKIEHADRAESSALVCYRFDDNEMLVREQFFFAGPLITRSVQTELADQCEGF